MQHFVDNFIREVEATENFLLSKIDEYERDFDKYSKNCVRKLIEFRPDREALIDIMLTSGFQSVEVLEPKPEANATFYATGEKSVLLCRK